MSTTHAAVVVVPDDGTSPVGTNEWNASHATTLSNGETAEQRERLVLPSAQRFTGSDTTRMRILDVLDVLRSTYRLGPAEILNDNWLLQYKRAILVGNARVTLTGNGELFMFDLAPVGRLVLAGRGL